MHPTKKKHSGGSGKKAPALALVSFPKRHHHHASTDPSARPTTGRYPYTSAPSLLSRLSLHFRLFPPRRSRAPETSPCPVRLLLYYSRTGRRIEEIVFEDVTEFRRVLGPLRLKGRGTDELMGVREYLALRSGAYAVVDIGA